MVSLSPCPAPTTVVKGALSLNTGWFLPGVTSFNPNDTTNTSIVNGSAYATGSYQNAAINTNLTMNVSAVALQANSVNTSTSAFFVNPNGSFGYFMNPPSSYLNYWLACGQVQATDALTYLVDFDVIEATDSSTNFSFNFKFPTIPNVFLTPVGLTSTAGCSAAVAGVSQKGASATFSGSGFTSFMYLAISPAMGQAQPYPYQLDAGNFPATTPVVGFNYTFQNPPCIFLSAQQASQTNGNASGILTCGNKGFTYIMNPSSTQANATYIAIGRTAQYPILEPSTTYLNTGYLPGGASWFSPTQTTGGGSAVTSTVNSNNGALTAKAFAIQGNANNGMPTTSSFYSGSCGGNPSGSVCIAIAPSSYPNYIFWLACGTLSTATMPSYLVDFGVVPATSGSTTFSFNFTFPTNPNVFVTATNVAPNGNVACASTVSMISTTQATATFQAYDYSSGNAVGTSAPSGFMYVAISPALGMSQPFGYSVQSGSFGVGGQVQFSTTFNSPPCVLLCAQEANGTGSATGVITCTRAQCWYSMQPPSTQANATWIALART